MVAINVNTKKKKSLDTLALAEEVANRADAGGLCGTKLKEGGAHIWPLLVAVSQHRPHMVCHHGIFSSLSSRSHHITKVLHHLSAGSLTDCIYSPRRRERTRARGARRPQLRTARELSPLQRKLSPVSPLSLRGALVTLASVRTSSPLVI